MFKRSWFKGGAGFPNGKSQTISEKAMAILIEKHVNNIDFLWAVGFMEIQHTHTQTEQEVKKWLDHFY